MATAQEIPVKFVKSLLATGTSDFTPTHASRFVSRLLYEFWGFCVNGGNDLRQPGGIVDVRYPTGFSSGSSVLLASGSDGATTFGTDIFASFGTDFTHVNSGSLIGKYLVTWTPDGSSTDDSVYFIRSVADSHRLQVEVTSGGTRRLGNHACFWDRQGVNWRIVDIVAATYLSGWQNGDFMVLSLPAAGDVNTGQAVPQLAVMHRTQSVGFGANIGAEGNVGIVVSPSGSWNVASSSFSDGTTELVSNWFNGTSSGSIPGGHTTYTFIGGKDFLIAEARSVTNGPQGTFTAGSGFHVEVPKRTQPRHVDPNPLAWLTWSNATPNQVAGTYYDGVVALDAAGTMTRMRTLVRSPGGTQVRPAYTGNAYGSGQWQQFGLPAFRFAFVSLNIDDITRLTSDGVLCSHLSGRFSVARSRLRRVRFTSADTKRGTCFGDYPGWTHVANGVLWPWDNTLMPQGPWRFGV